jgi:ADP-heptose:LPS heptosyltransferase
MVVFNKSCNKILSFKGYIFYPKSILDVPDDIFNGNIIQTYLKRGQLECIDGSFNYIDYIIKRKVRLLVLSRHYALGDLLFVTALIDGIKKIFPNLKLYIKTSEKCQVLLQSNPNIITITSQTEFENILRVADLHIPLDDIMEQYEDRLGYDVDRNRIEILYNHLGIEYNKELPRIYVEQKYLNGVYNVLTYPQPYIAICHQSLRVEKSLHPDKFIELIKSFKNRSCTLFTFGIDRLDYKQNNLVNLEGASLKEAIAWMLYMNVAVTLDSFWSHACAGFNIPQVLLTSCTDGELLSKDYPECSVIHADMSCYPCWYKFERGGCHLGEYPQCLNNIPIEYIKQSIEDRLCGL